MAALHSGQWINFFRQAGIPDKAAATYALTFAENRIQMNMLLDLNKEYLRDMGISLMGDVIAILRHAKAKHDEIAREKLLVTNNREKVTVSSKAVEVAPVTVSKPTVPASKPSSASRTLDHHARESLPTVSASKSKPKVPSMESGFNSDNNHSRKLSIPQSEATVPVKRKSKPTLSSLETITIEDDAPPKKARRVSPEEEGGYKIKMPSGSTPRSQQILAKSKELARRKTVFQRLGGGTSSKLPSETRSPPSASAVSSTTGASAQSFTIVTDLSTRVSKKTVKSESSQSLPNRSQSTSSVFRRLGDKQVSSSTQSVGKREEALPYAGILKSPPEKYSQRIVQKPMEKVTMVADSVDTGRTEVRERLGSVLKPSSIGISQKLDQKKSVPDSSKLGIKSRLGGTNLVSDKYERDSPVKERLKMPVTNTTARLAPYPSSSVSSDKIKPKSRGVFSRLGS